MPIEENTYYSYDDNRPLWNLGGGSSYYGYRGAISSSSTVEINFGKLFLEEMCIAGFSAILYFIIKNRIY